MNLTTAIQPSNESCPKRRARPHHSPRLPGVLPPSWRQDTFKPALAAEARRYFPPGEVSESQLNAAIAGTSANTNAISTLDSAFADPDMEALRQKLNEMILNGRR